MKDPRPLLQKTTLESLNYSDTYDVYSTPRIFVLDKDKKIKFKQIGVEQLEEIMDDITGHKTDVKLFPYDPTKPDDEQHSGFAPCKSNLLRCQIHSFLP